MVAVGGWLVMARSDILKQVMSRVGGGGGKEDAVRGGRRRFTFFSL